MTTQPSSRPFARRATHWAGIVLAALSLPVWLRLIGNASGDLNALPGAGLVEAGTDWFGPLVLILVLGLCALVYAAFQLVVLLLGLVLVLFVRGTGRVSAPNG